MSGARHDFFVTGTDTGVGKTWIAAALITALRKAGRDVVPMKPVQTGCGPRAVAPDIEWVLNAAAIAPSPDELSAMCPYRFALAASPHLRSAIIGRVVQRDSTSSA